MANTQKDEVTIPDLVERKTTMLLTKYLGAMTALKDFAKFATKDQIDDVEFLKFEKIEIILPNEVLTTPNAIVNTPTKKTSATTMRLHAIGAGVPIDQIIIRSPRYDEQIKMYMAACVYRLALERTAYILNALLDVAHVIEDPKLKQQHYMNLVRQIGTAMTVNGWSSANIASLSEQFSNIIAPQSIYAMLVDLQSTQLLNDPFPITNNDQLVAQLNNDWVEPKPQVIGTIKFVTMPRFYTNVLPSLSLRSVWSLYMACFISKPATLRTFTALPGNRQFTLAWPNWQGGAWTYDVTLGAADNSILVVHAVNVDGTFGIIGYGNAPPVTFVEGANMYINRVRDANTHMETAQFKQAIGARVLDTETVLSIPCRSVRSLDTRYAPGHEMVPTVGRITLTGGANDVNELARLANTEVFVIEMTPAAVTAYKDSVYHSRHVYDLANLLSMGGPAVYDPTIRNNFFDNQEIDPHRVPNLGIGLAMPLVIRNTDLAAAVPVGAGRGQEMIDCNGPGKTLSAGVEINFTLQTTLPEFDYTKFANMCAAGLSLN